MSSRRALGVLPARTAVLVLALALGLTACSGDDDEAARADPKPRSSPSSATPTPAAPAAEVDAECSVRGFHTVGRKILDRQRTVVVYAARHALAPGSSSRGAEQLSRADVIRIRVVAESGEVPREVRDSVLSTFGRVWPASGPAEDLRPYRFDLANDTAANQNYIVYRAADVMTGRWSQTMCGAPYNDGTEVGRIRGTFSGLSKIRPVKTYLCGSAPTDADQRAAARLCRL